MREPRRMERGHGDATRWFRRVRGPRRRRSGLRVPVLVPLLVVGVLLSLSVDVVPDVAPVAYRPWCLVDTDIPEEAYVVEQFVRTHNFSPPRGLMGGSVFRDTNRDLPRLLGPFKEYDVYPRPPGETRRPPQRIVLSDKLPYLSWYSPDHYETFMLMFPIGCLPDAGGLVPRSIYDGGSK